MLIYGFATALVPILFMTMAKGVYEKDGVGIGKFHTQGALDVGGDIYINGYSMKCDANGKLWFNNNLVAVTESVSFSPFLFSNSQPSAYWTMLDSWGTATYFGNLIFAQGYVKANHNGSPNGNAEVAIGGLPELNVAGYTPISIGFMSGLTTNLNNQTYAPRGYIEWGASYIRLCFEYRAVEGWQYLKSTHIRNGEIYISFSVLYRWR